MAVEPWRGQLATQPYNRVVIPPPETSGGAWWGWGFGTGTPPSVVWDVVGALHVPAVSRAVSLYAGMIRQCAMDAYRGVAPLERPRLLDAPDPGQTRSWYVGVQVEDYICHGNAISLVTARSAEGWPLAVQWLPAAGVTMLWQPGQARPDYYYGADRDPLPFADIIHVRRSADRWNPWRGVGVIEQHLATFDRAALEEAYERSSLTNSGVPSVGIISPNPALSEDEASDGKGVWMDKFGGPVREPAILPYGTQIIPLGWSPADSQMVEARKATLQDVANAFNLDGYWLGAPASGLTYRSVAPLYLSLVRTSLEPVLTDFELAWGQAWLPRGQSVRFDRLQLTRDDFLTSLAGLTTATAADGPVITRDEARLYLGLAATGPASPSTVSPVDTSEVA